MSFSEVGSARVRKNALFVLQTYAVCRNLRTGVSAEYLASKIYIIESYKAQAFVYAQANGVAILHTGKFPYDAVQWSLSFE